MKRHVPLVLALVVSQLVILFGMLWLEQSLDDDSLWWPLILFAMLPPFIMKYAFYKLHRKLSWKRLLITHAATAIVVIGVMFIAGMLLADPGCGCGGG